jgi:hypothetical protein
LTKVEERMMSGWYDEKAQAYKKYVESNESDLEWECERDVVDRAVIHTREELTLIASYLSSVNEQLSSVKFYLRVISVMIGIGIIMNFGKF